MVTPDRESVGAPGSRGEPPAVAGLRCVFVGDEVTALGYRLAGVEIQVADAGHVAAVLSAARERADLILVSAALAGSVPAGAMDEMLGAVAPLVLVVPDARSQGVMPDLAARLGRELGVGP